MSLGQDKETLHSQWRRIIRKHIACQEFSFAYNRKKVSSVTLLTSWSQCEQNNAYRAQTLHSPLTFQLQSERFKMTHILCLLTSGNWAML